jgi:hypothetical protein
MFMIPIPLLRYYNSIILNVWVLHMANQITEKFEYLQIFESINFFIRTRLKVEQWQNELFKVIIRQLNEFSCAYPKVGFFG